MKYRLFFIVNIFIALFIVSLSGAETSFSEFYVVGPNDVLHIGVLEHDELSTTVTVSSDGAITFPYIGTISVKGMNLSEVQKIISKKLSEGYLKYPVVTVSLVKSLSKKIYTYGEVNRRGEIYLEENITVLKALSIAAGLTENGIYGRLKISRKKKGDGGYKDIGETWLNNGVIEDKNIENMILQPDDILTIDRNKTFLIQGEVAQRGRFVLQKDMTVLNALLQAGGATQDGRHGRIKIRRKVKSESDGYINFAEAEMNDGVIEDRNVENIILQPDDILIVERNKTILIQGEVAQRGRMVLEKDMKLLNALLQAGGVTENGLYGNIKFRRKQKEDIGSYKDTAESKLSGGVIDNSEIEDIALEPDDIIIVERNKTYFIYGEANKTGEFVLQKDMTVFKALTIAGGFTKWGSESRVKILRKASNAFGFETIKVDIKKVIDGDSASDFYLQSGDIVVVSKGLF